ncbi:hypothetical protein NEIFLAOT_00669 [Neisseria flavescens NRL30031/H210]|uniref:Uncharacterized protein n=1 Tax=Neisseria flavescens NRL30031/H210 TaxID=546264 RepID=C0EL64_NEIFL|nr:hypothetical protein NEIFLAOT_00669 [Neisseria flavescens NRL30031/H210]
MLWYNIILLEKEQASVFWFFFITGLRHFDKICCFRRPFFHEAV